MAVSTFSKFFTTLSTRSVTEALSRNPEASAANPRRSCSDSGVAVLCARLKLAGSLMWPSTASLSELHVRCSAMMMAAGRRRLWVQRTSVRSDGREQHEGRRRGMLMTACCCCCFTPFPSWSTLSSAEGERRYQTG